MTEATEAARVTLAQLNEKLAEFDRRAIELENEATGISLAAMTGDAAARKRLDALNRERSAHELESRNIKSAIRAQEAVVAEAERAEAMAGMRAKAEETALLAAEYAELGPGIDADFSRAAEKLERAKQIMDRLDVLGASRPRHEQISVLSGLALTTHLMRLPIRTEREHLAPRERHTFAEIYAGWAAMASRGAAPFLDGAEAA